MWASTLHATSQLFYLLAQLPVKYLGTVHREMPIVVHFKGKSKCLRWASHVRVANMNKHELPRPTQSE